MNEIIKSKLNEIIDMDMSTIRRDNYNASTNEIERIYNINIPLDYKEFLLEYGGSFIKDGIMYQPIESTPVTPEDGFDSINYFYGITNDNYDIELAIQTYIEVLGTDIMPIADAGGGDLICIGLKEEYRGKVYYWYHEREKTIEGREHFYLIANSFKEFILKFMSHEREYNINLDDIDISLDDDLLKD
ncbi:SMI1/KNR4 family protein [Oceanobacillus timonensis]|uniref:SMI1/KNR4 family protein n=1 Tax=Oceanobacillus timonensis TaxID=1926285 RepID=UPI0009BAAF97|nr:SMI1/KNR4 family protein [Oceanobacillus timonensis]